MITVADRRSGPAVSTGIVSGRWRATGAPVRVIQLYTVLLILIPPTQIIEPLGAVGTPATVVGLVALVHWAVAVVTPGEGLARTVVPVRLVVGLLAATVLLRYAVLHVGYVPVDELLASDRIVLAIFSWAGVALLAAEGLQDRAEINRVLRVLVVVVAMMAFVAFLQFRAGIDLTTLLRRIPGLHENADLVTIQARGAFRRPSGTATHPIEFGCVIAMVLPLALHAARFDVFSSRVRGWLPMAMIAIGIPVAVSRSAILGAVVAGLVIFLGLPPRVRPRALVSVAGFLVIIYATTPGLLGTLRGFFLSTGSDSRINDYGPALAHIRQAPWFGHGPGTFIADSVKNNVLDNQYLLTLIEVGLVGLVVVLVYLLATAFLGRGARHRSNDAATRDLGQALAAGSVAGAVTAYTFDSFSFRMFAGVIPLCLGMAGALWATTRTGERIVEAGTSAAVSPVQAGGGTPVALHAVPVSDLPDDEADRVAARAAEVELPAGTTVIDASDAALALHDASPDEALRLLATPDADVAGGTVHDVDEGLDWPPEPDRPTGTRDLRRIAVLIGAAAAVSLLVGLPFLIERSDGGQVAQVSVATAPGVVPPAMASTTIMGQPVDKADQTRAQAPAGRPRAGGITTTRGSATWPPSPWGTSSQSTRLPLGGGPSTGPTATTAPPTATTAPPTATTAPPTPTTEPPPTTTTTESTTTTTAATTTTTTTSTIP